MNTVVISGIRKGDFEDVGNDGVMFTLVTKSGRNDELDEFKVLAYGNAAAFLQHNSESGDRVVGQGRVSSEKLGTEVFHSVITLSRVLGISDSNKGIDFATAVVSGETTSEGISQLPSGTELARFDTKNVRRWRGKDGDTKEYTNYVSATAWKNTAESIEQSYGFPMEKEQVVYEGALKPRSYENKDGVTVYKLDIWINELEAGGGTGYSGNSKSETSSAPPASKPKAMRSADDAPF